MKVKDTIQMSDVKSVVGSNDSMVFSLHSCSLLFSQPFRDE